MQALSECNGTIQQLKVKHVPTNLRYSGKLFWGSGFENWKLMVEFLMAACPWLSVSCQPRSPSLRNCRMRTVSLQCSNWCPSHDVFTLFRSAHIFHSGLFGWGFFSSLSLFLKSLFVLMFEMEILEYLGLCILLLVLNIYILNAVIDRG